MWDTQTSKFEDFSPNNAQLKSLRKDKRGQDNGKMTRKKE